MTTNSEGSKIIIGPRMAAAIKRHTGRLPDNYEVVEKIPEVKDAAKNLPNDGKKKNSLTDYVENIPIRHPK